MFSAVSKTKKPVTPTVEPKPSSSDTSDKRKSLAGEGFAEQEAALVPIENKQDDAKQPKEEEKRPSLLDRMGALKHGIGKHIRGSGDWARDMWAKAKLAAQHTKLEYATRAHRNALYDFALSEYSPENLLAYEDVRAGMGVAQFYQKWVANDGAFNVGGDLQEIKTALADCRKGDYDKVDIGVFEKQTRVNLMDTFKRFRDGPLIRLYYRQLTGRDAPADFK